ncbi:HAMP domain-containing sensor histidine kinase [Methylobacterium nigriterrae]|uniref:HAMP domain-containing sensor histidine kinase n=1 Tax=Methylobacterium nigriterrae TaxID=3127512 RepID=UPI003013226F
MRVGRKILLVGGVPILIAAAIAVAGWLLLAQEERARGGAVHAGQVDRVLALARMVRDDYVGARAAERAAHAERFLALTAEAGAGLDALKSYVRTAEQTARIESAQAALSRYVARMRAFIGVTRDNDGLIAEMATRASRLVELADRARLRQQASNADLVRSLSEKVQRLSTTRDVVAGINGLQAIAAELALERARGEAAVQPAQVARLREAAASLATALRAQGRKREADEIEGLAASEEAGTGEGLAEWSERILKIDSSGQRTLHEEVAQLLTYAIEANETEQATQNIAVTTLRLGQRTADALVRRDPPGARAMLEEGEQLSGKASALPISPLIQAEMVDAIDGWRKRLTTTIGGLERQTEMLADMDGLAAAMSASAQSLNDAFIGEAERFGASIRQILLAGAAAGLLIGTLVALAVARAITTPLRQLQGDMIALAANPAAGRVSGLQRADELGDIARATNFFVTEIARREQALRRAKDQADAALLDLRQAQADLIRAEKLASLGQLVAGVAHEINTPLGLALTTATVVRDETRGFQATLAEGQLSRSRLTHYVERVQEGAALLCTNLARAADLVHGFKQVAVDRVSDEQRRFALDIWLDELLASLKPLLRQGGHAVTRDCPPLTVDTNPGALAQVVTNCITNAVVHGFEPGRPGHIGVRVSEAGPGLIRLDIADDGRGIPPENLERIFDPFFTTARSRGSTGLGMHIVHNLVTVKLGGRIALASRPGEGTRVRIEFPAAIQAPARPALRAAS